MIAAQNDEAIPLLQPLIDRLAQLPESQRRAANRRLDQILFQAITDLVFYLSYRDQYGTRRWPTRQRRRAWRPPKRAHVLAAARRLESCCRPGSGATSSRLASRGAHGRHRPVAQPGDERAPLQPDRHSAQAALRETEHAVNRGVTKLSDNQDIRLVRAQLAYLKAHLTLAQGNLAECMAWAEHASGDQRFLQAESGIFLRAACQQGSLRRHSS